MIDSHTHLDHPLFRDDIDEVVTRAVEEGVRAIVNIGYDPDSARATAGFVDKYPFVYGVVGTHPHNAAGHTLDYEVELKALLDRPRIIGVGEIALSDHRSSQPTLDELLRVAADTHVAGLMTDKAGLAHLHMGDGDRGLDLVRQCLDTSEIPARVFHPTHVNRRRALFQEALELAQRGCSIDVTAFPVEDDDEGLSAVEAVESYLQADLPSDNLTVSSDAGGSLPDFDEDGRVQRMGVGQPSALSTTLGTLLQRGHALEAVLPTVTSNVAKLFRLAGKGRIEVGADADLVVLDNQNAISDVMAMGRWHFRQGQVTVRGTFE